MNTKLWERFNQSIERINGEAASAEFITIKFDGWLSVRNESVLGFMISSLGDALELRTYCLANLEMKKGIRLEMFRE